jgi:hypothetical protein
MKPIGGYFELELQKGNSGYHNTPHALKSGRSCLHHLLNIVRPSLVYIPFYTCDALLEPFMVSGINYQYYTIDQNLEIAGDILLKDGEYLVYINYFDLKRQYTARLAEQYGDKLIIDATQAFFMKGDGRSWLFNSCRKFFGVPDGAYLYAPANIDVPLADSRNERYITEHLIKRFNGHTQEGYNAFVTNESLCDSAVTGISKLSEYLLSEIDYEEVIKRRRINYAFLFNAFKDKNLLAVSQVDENVPMCYPLLAGKKTDKRRLADNGIFIPSFWEDVLKRNSEGFVTEKIFVNNLLPLPVDHRLEMKDMSRLADAVTDLIGS